MTFSELIECFKELSLPSYRAKQVYEWVVKGVSSFEEMKNLPKKLREELSSKYFISDLNIKDKKVSKDGTIKYLFELDDDECIESVVMKYNHGYTLCLSTQAGCKMGCLFCKTGKMGFIRNLSSGEMISQIQKVQKDLNIRISNLVLMGMGEPLDNYDNVLKFLKMISSETHLNIGMRHISLSTCGIVDKIYKLADENLQLTLSISIHASNNEVRKKLMRISHKWDINELIKSCQNYSNITHRRISFEYVMIKDVNDDIKYAKELAMLLKGIICHVNLIPFNGSEENLSRSSNNSIYRFKNALESYGVSTTIRRTLGEDIQGACGQLRYSHLPKEV